MTVSKPKIIKKMFKAATFIVINDKFCSVCRA